MLFRSDTARSYSGGNNERMVGAALKGKRNQITLSTKTEGRNKEEAKGSCRSAGALPHGRGRPQGQTQSDHALDQNRGPQQRGSAPADRQEPFGVGHGSRRHLVPARQGQTGRRYGRPD